MWNSSHENYHIWQSKQNVQVTNGSELPHAYVSGGALRGLQHGQPEKYTKDNVRPTQQLLCSLFLLRKRTKTNATNFLKVGYKNSTLYIVIMQDHVHKLFVKNLHV